MGSLVVEQKVRTRELGKLGESWTLNGVQVARNQVVAHVCEAVSGGQLISEVLGRPGLPSLAVFLGWLRSNSNWKKAYQEAEEAQAVVFHDRAYIRARDSVREATQASVKADELFVKTSQWSAERLHRKKFGENAVPVDLKDELRGASEDQLVARIAAAVIAFPAALEKLAPKLKELMPEDQFKALEEKALAARQAASIEGEVQE